MVPYPRFTLHSARFRCKRITGTISLVTNRNQPNAPSFAWRGPQLDPAFFLAHRSDFRLQLTLNIDRVRDFE